MNGFEAELRERILGMTSHASITGENNQLRDWTSLEPALQQENRVLGWAPYIEGQAMLKFRKPSQRNDVPRHYAGILNPEFRKSLDISLSVGLMNLKRAGLALFWAKN